MFAGVFLNSLATRAKGLMVSFDLVNTRLSTQRAANLDRLTNLTGPVVLQSNLGTAADPMSLTTTFFAGLQHVHGRVVACRNHSTFTG